MISDITSGDRSTDGTVSVARDEVEDQIQFLNRQESQMKLYLEFVQSVKNDEQDRIAWINRRYEWLDKNNFFDHDSGLYSSLADMMDANHDKLAADPNIKLEMEDYLSNLGDIFFVAYGAM